MRFSGSSLISLVSGAQFRRLAAALGWNRSSSVLLSVFLLTIGLIIYVWWPLAEEYLALIDWNGPWWLYLDWLLINLFAFMSLTIVARADLRRDSQIIFIGAVGGLVIEAWGTQTNLWHYYTAERPPLWIIPAWPIASLSIDRLTRLLNALLGKAEARWLPQPARRQRIYATIYGLVFTAFSLLMLHFIWPTLDKSLTQAALLLSLLLIVTPSDRRMALLVFAAGSGLGYYLELWGTTRECWTYYTRQTPPLFAVLAHGMAALAFWRSGHLLTILQQKWAQNYPSHAPHS